MRRLLLLLVALLLFPAQASAHPEHSDVSFHSVTVLPADWLTDSQPVLVINKGFGADLSDVRIEQCTEDLTACDATNVRFTTTGRNGRFGSHGNPSHPDDEEIRPIEFTVRAGFEANGRKINCVPRGCVIQAGKGTEYVQHAPLGFGVPIVLADQQATPSSLLPSDRALSTAPTAPTTVPDEGPPPVDALAIQTPDETETIELTTTTVDRLQMEPAASEGAWSVLPIIIGLLALGALLLLTLGLRRPRRPERPLDLVRKR